MSKNVKKIFLVILCLIAFGSDACSNERGADDVKDVYSKFFDIMHHDSREIFMMQRRTVEYIVNPRQFHVAMDYAVEILEKAPWSLASYYTEIDLMSSDYSVESDEKSLIKYIEWKNIYLDNLDNRRTDDPRKLVFLIVTLFNHYDNSNHYDLKHQKDMESYRKIIYKIAQNNPNPDIRAIAFVIISRIHMLFFYDGGYKTFANKFPGHRASPLMKLYDLYYSRLSHEKFEKEILKFISKHGEIELPRRWKLKAECYAYLAEKYINANNSKKTRLYIYMLKKCSPAYAYIEYFDKVLRTIEEENLRLEKLTKINSSWK